MENVVHSPTIHASLENDLDHYGVGITEGQESSGSSIVDKVLIDLPMPSQTKID